ncbi:hypothetical protein LSH36_2349g00002 [Paralvinella palmiformis]|uniref:Fibrinogen C-terminal domain-containing protein n=1 Tax=Paralvinella palmiformis TaxID=53620 RepID=A0AAD9MKN2_9ANNE|nr:hypothetical protein LSH36_2349g00002 [Paralvinella palmiformis]
MYGRKETCLYGCRCSGCCEEIQIIRMPSSIAGSSWFLCDLQLTFEPGNELIHKLTNDGRSYTLRIDLTNYLRDKIFAKMGGFTLGSESECYIFQYSTFDNITSTAQDKMTYNNGCQFSTGTIDNDRSINQLAQQYHAPWWYCKGLDVVLTGYNDEYSGFTTPIDIRWYGPWNSTTYAKHAMWWCHRVVGGAQASVMKMPYREIQADECGQFLEIPLRNLEHPTAHPELLLQIALQG